jgi:drug/metabolite transporter (DMT)-like permease
MKRNPQLECLLYVLLSALSYSAGFFSTDDAAKYIGAIWLWSIRGSLGLLVAMILAWKTFRSNPGPGLEPPKQPEPPKP